MPLPAPVELTARKWPLKHGNAAISEQRLNARWGKKTSRAAPLECYFEIMDIETEIPHRKRGMGFLIVAVIMLILGETLLRHSLGKVPFVLYWLACLVFTGLAIIFAFLDVAGVQREARERQRELLQKTIEQIAHQKQSRSGSSSPE